MLFRSTVNSRPQFILNGFARGLVEAAVSADVEIDPPFRDIYVAAGYQDNLGADQTRGGDDRPAGLDGDIGNAIAEMPDQGGIYARRNILQQGHLGAIGDGKSTTEIEQLEVDAVGRKVAENLGGAADRAIPRCQAALLAANVEGYAVGVQAHIRGRQQEIPSHGRRAAKFAVEGPQRAAAFHSQTAKNPAPGGRGGELTQFLLTIEGEEPDAEIVGAGYVRLLLNRVAV